MIKVLVSDIYDETWDYKVFEVSSEAEFEYQVLSRKTRDDVIEYVGRDGWTVGGHNDDVLTAGQEIDPDMPIYFFGDLNNRATFMKYYKDSMLYVVETYIENGLIVEYSED